ncbi:heme o synthase [Pseudoalteromonas fenneropenaei]|uniref:Protoheme IX farnesyltransferase n=1 Tax=Pseudoalteromonas fenneropenaei TaxID=1737459 RepID=A0ABV7CQL9_9GAMM
MTTSILIQARQLPLLTKMADYIAICKAKVVLLLVLTAWVGLALAPDMSRSIWLQLASLAGIGVLAAAAAAINHVVDREIDRQMARTRHRPVAMERLSTKQALWFAALMTVCGTTLLIFAANLLCAMLTLASLVGYAVVYTSFLKRRTPQNIVIGGLAGAMPPLLGWVSETGALAAEPWLLVMIVFTWTPPHFWALAIARRQDYARANVPMLPVTHGVEFTKLCILIYTIILTLVCVLPYLIGMSGWVYLASACVLNGMFLQKAVELWRRGNDQMAMRVFRFSILHLLLLFVALFIDRWV